MSKVKTNQVNKFKKILEQHAEETSMKEVFFMFIEAAPELSLEDIKAVFRDEVSEYMNFKFN